MASTHILAIGKVIDGNIIMTKHAYVEYLCSITEDDEPLDGLLQAEIDFAAEVEDYEDYLADVEFWRTGC